MVLMGEKKIKILDVATKCKPKAHFVSFPNKEENVGGLGLEWDELFNWAHKQNKKAFSTFWNQNGAQTNHGLNF